MVKVLAAIQNGLTVKDACAITGISRQTLYNHLEKDEQFRIEYDKAIVAFKLKHLRNVESASANDWKASAWILERKFKEEFSLRTELVGKDGEDLNFQVKIMDGSSDKQDIPTP